MYRHRHPDVFVRDSSGHFQVVSTQFIVVQCCIDQLKLDLGLIIIFLIGGGELFIFEYLALLAGGNGRSAKSDHNNRMEYE